MQQDATAWRFAVGQQVAQAYAADPIVRAVVIGGSVGRGNADAYSDLEINVFWAAPPSDAARQAAAERAGGSTITLWPFYEPDEEWSSEYVIGELKVGIGEFTVETIERFLHDAHTNADPALAKQLLIAVIQYGRPVYGEELVRQWQAQAANYPRSLAVAMVEAHLDLDLGSAHMLAVRDDLLMFYLNLCAVQRELLSVLAGLNRVYIANPKFKWLDQFVAELAIAPPDLGVRLKHILRSAPLEAVPLMAQVINETFALIESQLPEIDTAAAKAAQSMRVILAAPEPAAN